MTTKPRARYGKVEIVTTDDGHHARIRAGNGQVLMHSETFRTKRAALNNLTAVTTAIAHDTVDHRVDDAGNWLVLGGGTSMIEILYVDERTEEQ